MSKVYTKQEITEAAQELLKPIQEARMKIYSSAIPRYIQEELPDGTARTRVEYPPHVQFMLDDLDELERLTIKNFKEIFCG